MAELSREELSNSIDEMRQQVSYLLCERPRAPAHRGKGPPRPLSLPALGVARAPSCGEGQLRRRLMSEGRHRRCACGCGELVFTGGEEWDAIAPLGYRSLGLQDPLELDPQLPAETSSDPRAQRESCQRLATRRARLPAAGAEAAPAAGAEAAPRRPDYERLRQMARPRERDLEQPAKGPRPAAGGGRAQGQKRLAGAPGPAAAAPAPARARLAEHLEQAAQGVAPPQPAPLARAPPPPAAAHPGAPSGLAEWLAGEARQQRRARRTAQSQRMYFEDRLCRPRGPAPGSAAALQLRLEALRAERRGLEEPAAGARCERPAA